MQLSEKQLRLTKEEVSEAMDYVYERGDGITKFFVLGHLALTFVLAFFYDTWLESVVVGLAATALFFVSQKLLPKTFFTRAVAGISLQIFVILHIYQMHGLAEMHFFFFTAFTMLIVYQDWKSMWPGTLLIIGQHTVFALLTNSGVNLYFFEAGYIGVTKLIFHFGIAAGQVVVCGYWAYLLKKQTLQASIRQKKLSLQQLTIENKNAELMAKAEDLGQNLEEMKAQEEELKQQSEEMRATQDELLLQRTYINGLNEELERKIEKRTKELSEALSRAQQQESEMKQIEAELREKQHEMEKTQWLENNLSRFDDIMRLNYDKSVEEFSDTIMLHLARQTNSMRGAMFIFDENSSTLRAVGGFACTPAAMAKTEFILGEGLLGQAARSQEMIYLPSLPPNSARVSSSLSSVDNGSMIIVPLAYNDTLQGVIELLSIKPYENGQLDFIQRLSKNLAAMMQHIKNNIRTHNLLAESQEMTFQLQEQAEELRQNSEEIFATQEALAAQNADMQLQLSNAKMQNI